MGAVDAVDVIQVLDALDGAGYAAETDWLPSRVELRASGNRWVDVHPVAFGEDGGGRQPDLDGGFFEYPPDAFGRGVIAGRSVGCLSARQQRRFHDLGYEHRPQDIHDLAQLDALPDQ
jgi:lincosamide nucleotidyltransferase A/C/D/E